MFDQPRRRRRRRLVWPVLVSLIAAVAVVVYTVGSDAQTTIGYLADLRASAGELARSGTALSDVVADLSRVDRSEFSSVVDQVMASLEEASEVGAEEPPEASLVGAATLFRLAVESWQQGIEGAAEALLAAADDPDDSVAVDELTDAVVLVRAGDRIYQELTEELRRPGTPQPVTPLPEVELLPSDAPLTVLAPAWVQAARSATSELPLRPSIGIQQVSTTPEWVINAEEQLVVPATESLDVAVVVSNSGNAPSGPASLELVLAAGEGDSTVMSELVGGIEAGAQTSVIFSEVEVQPGTAYTLTVRMVGVEADLVPEDNEMVHELIVNAPTE